MSFQHFMKQLQTKRAMKNQQKIQPEWVSKFVDQIAELFVPLENDGRVGYECKMNERGWKIRMFLGRTEMIGGRDDGSSLHSNFEFNISELTSIFENLNVLKWETYPDSSDPNHYQDHSIVIAEGMSSGHFVQLELHSVPPNEIGPGFKQFPNGNRAIV
jgi:hypothetical protein